MTTREEQLEEAIGALLRRPLDEVKVCMTWSPGDTFELPLFRPAVKRQIGVWVCELLDLRREALGDE